MNTSSTISCLMFITIGGFIAFLFYRRKRIFSDLKDFYAQGGYTRREDCPVEYPFVDKSLAFVICSDGILKAGMPYTLMLGTKFSGGGQSRRQDDYFGFYIPAHPQLTDEWLQGSKQKVVERGDGWALHSGMQQVKKKVKNNWGRIGAPSKLPIRALRINDGIVIAWIGLHLRKQIEERMHDVLGSLQENIS